MKATIRRMVSLSFGAHVFHVPHHQDEESPTEFRDRVVEEIDKLAVGTGQMVRALHPSGGLYDYELPLAVIYRGGRATMIRVGDYVVRTKQFGRDGKAGLVVMDEDRFVETFGMADIGGELARPDYPHDVDAESGMSEDVQVRLDNGLPVPDRAPA